jgi:hypothetical protein
LSACLQPCDEALLRVIADALAAEPFAGRVLIAGTLDRATARALERQLLRLRGERKRAAAHPLHRPAPKARFTLSDAAGGAEGDGPPPRPGEDFQGLHPGERPASRKRECAPAGARDPQGAEMAPRMAARMGGHTLEITS